MNLADRVEPVDRPFAGLFFRVHPAAEPDGVGLCRRQLAAMLVYRSGSAIGQHHGAAHTGRVAAGDDGSVLRVVSRVAVGGMWLLKSVKSAAASPGWKRRWCLAAWEQGCNPYSCLSTTRRSTRPRNSW